MSEVTKRIADFYPMMEGVTDLCSSFKDDTMTTMPTNHLNLRRYGLVALFLCLSIFAHAQNVGINATGVDPHPSAMLDVNSIDKGVLVPRLTKAQKLGIPAPATGLLVYQLDDTIGFWFYTGTNWEPIFRTVEAGTGLTGGQIYSYGRIDLATTGVVPGTYGSSDSIPRFTVNQHGQLVFAGNVPVNHPFEKDSVIGNEITDTLNARGMLEMYGTGTTADPYRLGIRAGINIKDIWIWNGSSWTFAPLPVEKDSVVGNEIADTIDTYGLIGRTGSGTSADPFMITGMPGNNPGDIWQWNGNKWVSARLVSPLEQDSVIGNEIADTINSRGIINRTGSGTNVDPYRIEVNPGNTVGQVWQWDGNKWVPQTLVYPLEKDSVIGNEIADTSNARGILNRSGSGTTVDPYTVGINPGNNAGEVWTWDGSKWVPMVIVHPLEQDSVIGNEIADTVNARGILSKIGSGTAADPYMIGINAGNNVGEVWTWDGTNWVPTPITHPIEQDSVIGNEIADTTLARGILLKSGTGTATDPYLVGINPGSNQGDVWTWDGSKWVPMPITHPLEKDSIIGNEVTDTLNARGVLEKYGTGTDADPYMLGISAGNNTGDIWRWNGSAWIAVPLPVEVDAIIGNEIYDTITNGFLDLQGAGTNADPKSVGMKPGSFNGAYLRWNGTTWYSDSTYQNTLDMAYDEGGPGAGRNIIADSGPVLVEGTDGIIVQGTHASGASIGSPGMGSRMIYNPRKSAFRAGRAGGTQWDVANVGDYSFAGGHSTTASGNYSTAFGYGSVADDIYTFAAGDSSAATNRRAIAIGDRTWANGLSSVSIGKEALSEGENSISIGHRTRSEGPFSVSIGEESHTQGFHSYAFGYQDTAQGDYSVAMGYDSYAEGDSSIAIGIHTYTTNPYSVAIGNHVYAIADKSVALGSYVSSNNKNGSFIFGDGSTTNILQSSTLNQMTMRFDGGYYLYTNSAATLGVRLVNGATAWTTLSDRNTKENFEAVDGEWVISQLRHVPVSTWNYIEGDASVRNMGPMAQDFYHAFHLGGSDSLGITTLNFDGVNLAAIQALIKRTDDLSDTQAELIKSQEKIKQQETEISELRDELDSLRKRIERLEE